MKTALIIAAAPERDIAYIKALYDTLRDPFIICADGGMKKAIALGLPIDLMVGDMDSGGSAASETVALPTEKDFSDTEACVYTAAERGYTRVVIAGASGGRLDHMLCNLFLIDLYAKKGVECMLADAQNLVSRARSGSYSVPAEYRYVSIIPLDAQLTGLDLSGVKYPMVGRTVERGSSLTLSNEVYGDRFSVSIRSGEALLIFSHD